MLRAKKDLPYEHYVFNNRDQKEGETFFSFLTNITSQTGKCDFDPLKDSMICDCTISGIRSEHTKAKVRDPADLDLDTVISICKNNKIT